MIYSKPCLAVQVGLPQAYLIEVPKAVSLQQDVVAQQLPKKG